MRHSLIHRSSTQPECDAGSEAACRSLGQMFENGEGGEVDLEQARSWYELSKQLEGGDDADDHPVLA